MPGAGPSPRPERGGPLRVRHSERDEVNPAPGRNPDHPLGAWHITLKADAV